MYYFNKIMIAASYADDFLVGVIGSKADAERIKSDISRFLSDKLKLTMPAEKTLVTHGHDKAIIFLTCRDENESIVKGLLPASGEKQA